MTACHHKIADLENLCFPNSKTIYAVNFPITLQSVLRKAKAPTIAYMPVPLWSKGVHCFVTQVLEPSCLLNVICVFSEDTAEKAEVLVVCELMPMAQAEMPPFLFHSQLPPLATVTFMTYNCQSRSYCSDTEAFTVIAQIPAVVPSKNNFIQLGEGRGGGSEAPKP